MRELDESRGVSWLVTIGGEDERFTVSSRHSHHLRAVRHTLQIRRAPGEKARPSDPSVAGKQDDQGDNVPMCQGVKVPRFRRFRGGVVLTGIGISQESRGGVVDSCMYEARGGGVDSCMYEEARGGVGDAQL